MDNKVYTPEVITDQPILDMQNLPVVTTQATGNDTYSPAQVTDQPLPTKRIAQETISSTLNTKAKKILGEYQFTPNGAMQIGEFQAGVSGDIRISPDGITARDKSGNTTFDLDGDTGDGVFGGKLLAATLIGGNGNAVVEESAKGNGRIVLYTGGVASILIGDPS